jgi:hypothetical protein
VLPLEQRHRELCVVESSEPLGAHADERVERALGLLGRQEARLREHLHDRASLPAEASLGRRQLVDALHPAERGLYRPLTGHVGAEPQRREKLEALEIFGGVVLLAAEEDPPGAKAARAINLGQAAERRTERVLAELRYRDVLGAVVEDFIVNLV